MTHDPGSVHSARICFAQTLALLLLGLAPVPAGWARARSAQDSARSNEMTRTDREIDAGGYYQGLIGVDGPQGSPAWIVSVYGKRTDWVRFRAAKVSRFLEGDFLMFELLPNVDRALFGERFTTNSFGMRDRDYSLEKPEGTYRIAVLGSSIDMGWGVGTEETYVNLLEDWLNAHAARRGMSRRFEVLNFAVAAYSPMQRWEAFRRKAVAFDPDMVLYSATLLDTRLIEIYLCDLIQSDVHLPDNFLRAAFAEAGIGGDDYLREPDGKLANKDSIKAKLRPRYWELYDTTIGLLADDCRARGVPLACLIIPRVGKADAPELRAEPVARLRGIAAHHAVPMFDLTGTFDPYDPAKLEIAAWDDHPNGLGHHRLFRALARCLVDDTTLYQALFPPGDDPASGAHGADPSSP
jgi:hypothetical protein